MDRQLVATLSLVLTLGSATLFTAPRPAQAEDAPPAPKLACSKCGTVVEGANGQACPDDGAPLVRSDLVAFQALVVREARRGPFKNALENPLAACVKDEKVDVAALAKLVADYKDLLAKVQPTALDLEEETGVIRAIRAIESAQTARRRAGQGPGTFAELDGPKLVAQDGKDHELVCEPTQDGTRWFATAFPDDDVVGGRFLFVNQDGAVYSSKASFVVNKATAEVPAGLEKLSPRRALTCSKCGGACEDAGAVKCPEDGAPLVRNDLFALHSIVVGLALHSGPLDGLENPAAKCFHEGAVDGAALEKVVADYAALLETTALSPIELTNSAFENCAVGSLMTLATAQHVFHDRRKEYGTLRDLGTKMTLIDRILASGKKSGYRFVCEPSATDPSKWYATAFPVKPGTGRSWFDNQDGKVFYSRKPFVVDKDTCAVPAGLSPLHP